MQTVETSAKLTVTYLTHDSQTITVTNVPNTIEASEKHISVWGWVCSAFNVNVTWSSSQSSMTNSFSWEMINTVN